MKGLFLNIALISMVWVVGCSEGLKSERTSTDEQDATVSSTSAELMLSKMPEDFVRAAESSAAAANSERAMIPFFNDQRNPPLNLQAVCENREPGRIFGHLVARLQPEEMDRNQRFVRQRIIPLHCVDNLKLVLSGLEEGSSHTLLLALETLDRSVRYSGKTKLVAGELSKIILTKTLEKNNTEIQVIFDDKPQLPDLPPFERCPADILKWIKVNNVNGNVMEVCEQILKNGGQPCSQEFQIWSMQNNPIAFKSMCLGINKPRPGSPADRPIALPTE